MKSILKYITSVPVQNQRRERMKISLGSEKNGVLGLYFQDTSELGQDSAYINEESFPNSGLMAWGKYSLWLSMFSRHVQIDFDDSE
ncbi:MAG: hypothetical protein J5U17_12150 [Candidatus Methanoperedens sp.]|nr:hypothetical protein [Candidatus Methanoperedens sp.]MCE8428960.1 hypothetical protein [Candidatus Methanoperedens sp.]